MEQEPRPRQERMKRREDAKRIRRKIFVVFAIIVGISATVSSSRSTRSTTLALYSAVYCVLLFMLPL